MHKLILSLLLILGSASAAFCDDATQPPPASNAADMQSMNDFLRANPDCREFTDSCSYCAITDGAAECSTPQIACIKKDYQCITRSAQ